MDRASSLAETEHQATVPARIIWVILNQFTVLNHSTDLLGRDHAIRARHLPQCMRQIKPPLGRSRSDTLHDIRLGAHAAVLSVGSISSTISPGVHHAERSSRLNTPNGEAQRPVCEQREQPIR
jgi:hypothetical protein